MTAPVPPPSPDSQEMARRAQAVLARLDQQDKQDRPAPRRGRSAPGLMAILTPVWAWALGVAYLPDSMPKVAWGVFTASCWLGFGWLLFSAWRAHAGAGPASPSEDRVLQQDIARALEVSRAREAGSQGRPKDPRQEIEDRIERVRRARQRSESQAPEGPAADQDRGAP